ncbi:unnamed protein product [Rotaria sp. Silwood2]|nr:unnamed protein product [Rotaria sp. Silwood2]
MGNPGELLATESTRFPIIQIEVLDGPQLELVCRSEDVKEDQDVVRDRLVIDYCFVTNNDANNSNNSRPRCLTGGRKNIQSALVLTRDKGCMYTCCEINDYNIEIIFALILSAEENYLMTVTFKGFKIFSFRSHLCKTCLLPGSVRNIMSGYKWLTYTASFSQDNRYLIACVKSSVYVFEIQWGDLIASFDSHFGRILVVKCLSIGNSGNNYVITTDMDKTTKVWDLQNAKEKSISIAQLDKCIEMMHISTETKLSMAQSRIQLCLFDMRTGIMTGQLSINLHGSIYQCTVLCANGLFAASAESYNFVIYDIEERKASFITPLKSVFQLLLHSAETMVLVLTTEPVAPTTISSALVSTPMNTSSNGQTVRAISYGIPDGDIIYEIVANMKRSNQPKNFICTADDMYFVFIEEKKHTEILALYDPMTGEHVHYVKLSYPAYKEITLMVTIPKQPYLIGLIDSEKGIVMNVRDKKVKI